MFGCTNTKPTKKDLTSKIDSLVTVIKNQEDYINDLNYQIGIMRDELRYKEDEISYWGHKLDSVSERLKKYEK